MLGLHVPVKTMKQMNVVKDIAEDNLEDLDSELKFRRLRGEDYVNIRLRAHDDAAHLDDFEAEADRLDPAAAFRGSRSAHT
jgi:hypothetical protein